MGRGGDAMKGVRLCCHRLVLSAARSPPKTRKRCPPPPSAIELCYGDTRAPDCPAALHTALGHALAAQGRSQWRDVGTRVAPTTGPSGSVLCK